jgi:hypothetical protein
LVHYDFFLTEVYYELQCSIVLEGGDGSRVETERGHGVAF